MSKIIFDILLPPSNWDIQRYWAIGCSRLTITLGILGGRNYSPHVVSLWYLYLFCVLFVYISGNGILGAGVRKTWYVWENGYQLIIIWEPEGQFEDKAGCKYVQDATRLYLFRLKLEYFTVSCGQEFETDLQFHNKLQQGPGPAPGSENISIIYSHTYLTATVRQPTARLGKEFQDVKGKIPTNSFLKTNCFLIFTGQKTRGSNDLRLLSLDGPGLRR